MVDLYITVREKVARSWMDRWMDECMTKTAQLGESTEQSNLKSFQIKYIATTPRGKTFVSQYKT